VGILKSKKVYLLHFLKLTLKLGEKLWIKKKYLMFIKVTKSHLSASNNFHALPSSINFILFVFGTYSQWIRSIHWILA
jgi:hypothetical protein